MFIIKINKLFHKHGRIAFGILTIVIIIPFVLYFSADPADLFGMFSFGGGKSNVSMYGKRLPQKEVDNAVKGVLITLTLQGWPVDFNSSAMEKQYLPLAVDRLRLLKKAQQLGITSNPAEIAAYLREMPILQVNGKFDMKRYKTLVYVLNQRFNISEGDIESAASENVIIDEMRKVVTDATLVSQSGLREFYNNINAKYSIRVAQFDSSGYIDKVNSDGKDIEAYFSTHKHNYMLPQKSKAVVVRFNFINYQEQAEKSVNETMINSYYNRNRYMYGSDSEETAKNKIRDLLVKNQEQELAKNEAQKFAVNTYKLIENSNEKKADLIFTKAAESSGITAYPIDEWITPETEMINRIGKEPELSKTISTLFFDQPISNAVEGSKAYFVACLTSRINAKPAELEEVRSKVETDYRKSRSIELAKEAAEKADDALKSVVKDKSDISSELEKYSFDPAIEFSQVDRGDLLNKPFGQEAYSAAVKTAVGAVSNVADTANGAIIVYVQSINVPDKEQFEKEKKNFEPRYDQRIRQLAWMNYNLMLQKEADTRYYVKSGE